MNKINNIQQVEDVISSIESGEASAINCHEVYFFFKKCEELNETFKNIVRKNLEKYSPEELKDLKIEKKAGRTIWSFSHIPEFVEAKKRLKSIEDTAKIAASSNYSETTTVIDEETGEIIERPSVIPAHRTYSHDIYIYKK